jgi:hypothetical protein
LAKLDITINTVSPLPTKPERIKTKHKKYSQCCIHRTPLPSHPPRHMCCTGTSPPLQDPMFPHPPHRIWWHRMRAPEEPHAKRLSSSHEVFNLNSVTAKSVPAGTKLILFGRYVLNIYVGIVRYFLRKTKTRRAKIYLLYLPTQRTNHRISYDIN